jgi:hypothetical protein
MNRVEFPLTELDNTNAWTAHTHKDFLTAISITAPVSTFDVSKFDELDRTQKTVFLGALRIHMAGHRSLAQNSNTGFEWFENLRKCKEDIIIANDEKVYSAAVTYGSNSLGSAYDYDTALRRDIFTWELLAYKLTGDYVFFNSALVHMDFAAKQSGEPSEIATNQFERSRLHRLYRIGDTTYPDLELNYNNAFSMSQIAENAERSLTIASRFALQSLRDYKPLRSLRATRDVLSVLTKNKHLWRIPLAEANKIIAEPGKIRRIRNTLSPEVRTNFSDLLQLPDLKYFN